MNPILTIPKVQLVVGGQQLPVHDTRRLESVSVRQRLSQPTLCMLTFRDMSESSINEYGIPGKSLSVEVEGFSDALFDGEVTAIECEYEPSRGRIVRIRGYDLLHRLRKRQPVRSHLNIRLTDLANEMVQEFGLSIEAAEPGPVFRRVLQYRQSDLDLLVDLAKRAGLYLTVSGGTLHLITLEGYGEAIPLVLGRTLLEARVEMNADSVCSHVHADGWDPSVVEWERGSAASARSGRSIQASLEPLGGGGGGEITFGGLVAEQTSVLESQAQSELDRRVAGEATLWGIAQGMAELRPGRPIEVEGLASAFCGTYIATEVSHTISRSGGFVSEFSTSPPPTFCSNMEPSVPTVGVVTRIDDPEGLGRIRARLPCIGDLETEWMCVLTPGGGPQKGLVALPDVGDQVYIATSLEDPGLGIVLGAISGSKGLPDTGIEAGEVVRYSFQTPGGQRIRLDDQNQRVRVENSKGSFIEIAPEGVTLHCNTDLTVEAPGRNIVIQGQRIDFRRI